MDPIRKIPRKFTKKFGNKVINRQYFRRKTGLQSLEVSFVYLLQLIFALPAGLKNARSLSCKSQTKVKFRQKNVVWKKMFVTYNFEMHANMQLHSSLLTRMEYCWLIFLILFTTSGRPMQGRLVCLPVYYLVDKMRFIVNTLLRNWKWNFCEAMHPTYS